MGVFVQVENGDKPILEIEIYCSQWEGSGCLVSLSFGLPLVHWGKKRKRKNTVLQIG